MSSFNNLLNVHSNHLGHHGHQAPYKSHGLHHHVGLHRTHHIGPPHNPSTESCPERTPSDLLDQLLGTPIAEPHLLSSSPKSDHNSCSSSPRVAFLHKHHNHHHHSIQELIRHFGKKIHWKSDGGRRSSCSVDDVEKPEEFRERSKSLDSSAKRNLSDCEATYRIYNTILKEG